jgi:DNA repair protein RadC
MDTDAFQYEDTRRLQELPKDSLPRERLIRSGVQSLTNEELIAILLRTGLPNKNVFQIAREFCHKFNNEFHTITNFNQEALIDFITKNEETKIDGIGLNKLLILIAAMEFGRRVYKPTDEEMKALAKPILSASEVARFMFTTVAYNAEENFWAIYLDTKQTIIYQKPFLITRGLDTHTLINPKSIFRQACFLNASSVIIVHNHPSGDVTPSEADIRTTQHLIDAGKAIGIPIKDHIIIGRANIPPHYTSLRARDLCTF